MNEGSWIALLGENWAAKALGGLLMIATAAVGGWWASRAKIMNAVTNQVNSLMGHQQHEIQRLTEAELACTLRLERIVLRVEQLEGELRQEKQTVSSMTAVGKV